MYCSSCGKQLEPAARFCASCGVQTYVSQPFGTAPRGGGQLFRPRSPRMIAGVCAGFSEHYGWDLNLVRLLTVVVTLLTGVSLIAYLAAWIIIPEGQYALTSSVPPPPPPGAANIPSESAAH
jgi:phage shock protein C